MTALEIKNYALKLCGLPSMPDTYVIDYINEALDNLAIKYDTARKKVIIALTGTENEWTDLPSDCLAVKRCFKVDNNYVDDDFLIENNQIQFTDTGTYKVECLSMQEHISALTDTPAINIAYHIALAYWVAHKEISREFLLEDMVQGNNKVMLLQEYGVKAEEANNALSSMKRSRKRIKYADFF